MKNSLFVLLTFFSLILLGCKKDEDTAPLDYLAGVKDGFIKGTINTQDKDGKPISLEFDYNFRSDDDVFETSDSTVRVYREKSFIKGYNGYDYMLFRLKMDSLGANTVKNVKRVSVSVEKEVSPNKLFRFYASEDNPTPTGFSVTNLSYDRNSSTLTGNFSGSFDTDQTNTGKVASISGSFKSHIKTVIND